MTKEPVCPLCSGVLVKESEVWIQAGGSTTLCYALAWVCKECSASWPIGLNGSGWLVSKSKPLWKDGKKTE